MEKKKHYCIILLLIGSGDQKVPKNFLDYSVADVYDIFLS